jgi:uncharacterized protein YcsI (UPF0317 family)
LSLGYVIGCSFAFEAPELLDALLG